MKKYLLKAALLSLSAFAFVACSNDDDPDGPKPVPEVSYGMFVVNSGNQSKKIDGSLDYIDFVSNKITNNVFKTANGRSIGLTANDAVVYGSKVYIAVSAENTIEIIDSKTFRSLAQVKTDNSPRHIVAQDGKVYVSNYGGFVTRVDTLSMKADGKAEVGDYPEGMTALNGKLYVANSAYGAGTTVSVIDMATFKKTTDLEVPTNPVLLANDGTNLYLATQGKYKADYSGYDEDPALYKMATDGKTTKIMNADAMSLVDGTIYTFTCNYYNPEISFAKYDTKSGATTKMDLKGIDYPCAIGVDPVTKHIWVSSYNLSDYGYADYSAAGYICEFGTDGVGLNKYNTGVGPIGIYFYNNK